MLPVLVVRLKANKNRGCLSDLQDSTIKIWDTITGRLSITLSGHAQCVTCVKWGGAGLIYSASQDRTIKVWKADDVSWRCLFVNYLTRHNKINWWSSVGSVSCVIPSNVVVQCRFMTVVFYNTAVVVGD